MNRLSEFADPGWRSFSACQGLPSGMFVSSEPMRAEEERAAKQVCAVCPVVDPCLSYAVVNAVAIGVWGGHTPDERRPLRRLWLQDQGAFAGRPLEEAVS